MLPRGVNPLMVDKPVNTITVDGRFKLNQYVMLKDVVLPEFSRSKVSTMSRLTSLIQKTWSMISFVV